MYLETSDADAYFINRLFSDTWDFADDHTKTQALTMATARVEQRSFKGVKKVTDQELSFPRCYTTSSSLTSYSLSLDNPLAGLPRTVGLYCEDGVPQVVLDAVCEEALALLERGNSQRTKLQREGVQSYSIGSLSETFTSEAREYSSSLCSEARRLLRPYLATSVTIV